MALPEAPNSRAEQYLAKIAGQEATLPEAPNSRVEQYLDYIAENGTVSEEEIAEYVSEWMEENITEDPTVVIDTSLLVSGAAADSKKVGDELTEIKSTLNNVPNSSLELIDGYNYSIPLIETYEDKYPSGSIGSSISFVTSANAITKKFKIPDGVSSLYSRYNANSLTRITDADGIVLATGAASISSIPSGAKYLYLHGNRNSTPVILEDNLVWISNENVFNYATENTLYSPEYKAFYRDIIQPAWYNLLVDDSVPFVTEKDYQTLTVNLNNNTNMYRFYSNGNAGTVTISLTNTVTSGLTTVRLMYYSGTWKAIGDTLKELSAGEQTVEWTEIDFASLIQYNDATEFGFIFENSGVSTVTISSITGKNLSNLSTYALYDKHFVTMMQNVLSVLSNGISAGSKLNLRNPSGDKYGLMITQSNTLGMFKYVPDNMLIMGNSLAFGFSSGDEAFGMAATSGEDDFSYHLIEAIKEFNPNVSVDKLYSSPFEHAEALSTAQAFLTENDSYWNSNLDLVVIEMGDNVNTDTKRSVFAESFPLLLNKIRTQCPNARIVCVGVWFNNSTVHDIMTENSEKYGCNFVDITPIRNSETEGELGATVHFKDGTTTTVTEARVTHPGNLGMQRIANAIIETLDL